VLIASPSDVAGLRDLASEVMHQWNSEHSDRLGVVLLPIRHERDVVPQSGSPPQQAVNEQIVNDCDLCIAIFHSRIGTPTGDAESGTVEEIQRVRDSGKPVAIYFCEERLPSDTDPVQLQKLRSYRADCEKRGFVVAFTEPDQLRARLHHYLTHTVHQLGGPSADDKVEPHSWPLPKAALELFFRPEFPMWWEDQGWYRVGVRNPGPVSAENVVVSLDPIEPNPLPLDVLPAQLGKKDGGTFDCRINPGEETYFDVVRRRPDTPDTLQIWTVPAMGQEFHLDPNHDYRTQIRVTAANAEPYGPVRFVLRQREGEELYFAREADLGNPARSAASGERAADGFPTDYQQARRFFLDHSHELQARFPDQHVAIIGSEVVDHDADFGSLAKRVYTKHGVRPIFMPKTSLTLRRVRMPSPRVLRLVLDGPGGELDVRV